MTSRKQSRQHRSRHSRRSRNRRSRNANWQYHNNNNSIYRPPNTRDRNRYESVTSGNRAITSQWSRQPDIQVSQLNGSSSVLSSVLNRVTELWRRDEKNNEVNSIPGASVTNGRDATEITIREPAVSTLKFQCQLAHGSPTALVSGFNNPLELYHKIADSYDGITFDQILYCTRNTHRIDMDSVLSGSLMTTDFIFAHIRGQKKEVELVKEQPLLGVTLSDNWAGRVFIRKINPQMQLGERCPAIEVGDHIEQINGESMVGKRHYHVATRLREIPVGMKFTIRLVSPLKSGFSFIAPRNGGVGATKRISPPMTAVSGTGIIDGGQTIRFKSDGKAVIEEPSSKLIIDRLNDIFDSYLGFNDDELANTVIDIGRECKTLGQMEEKVAKSSLADFDFSSAFLFDLWCTVDDWKKDRLSRIALKSRPPTPYSSLERISSEATEKNEPKIDYSNEEMDDFNNSGFLSEENERSLEYESVGEDVFERNESDINAVCYQESLSTTDDSVKEDDDEISNETAATPLPPPPQICVTTSADPNTSVPLWLNKKKDSRVWRIVRAMDVD